MEEQLPFILLGFSVGIFAYLFLYTDYFIDRYDKNKKWKVAYWSMYIFILVAKVFIYIVGILLAGSIMASAKEKYWDGVKKR